MRDIMTRIHLRRLFGGLVDPLAGLRWRFGPEDLLD